MSTTHYWLCAAGKNPEIFLSIKGGWGRMGTTHIRLANATEDVLATLRRKQQKI